MKLKVGQKYILANGLTVKIKENSDWHPNHPFYGFYLNGARDFRWNSKGQVAPELRWYMKATIKSQHDIVSPAPCTWQTK